MNRHKFKELGETVVLYPDNYINDIEGDKTNPLPSFKNVPLANKQRHKQKKSSNNGY